MSNEDIKNIVKLRWAVYRLGALEGFWHSLVEEDVEGFMDFLFPKSKHVAKYMLMLSIVRNSEAIKNLPSGSYNLFKFPEQVEEQILNLLKEVPEVTQQISEEDSLEIIRPIATIVSDPDLFSSSVGSFDSVGMEDLISILAYRYLTAFQNHQHTHPYFE